MERLVSHFSWFYLYYGYGCVLFNVECLPRGIVMILYEPQVISRNISWTKEKKKNRHCTRPRERDLLFRAPPQRSYLNSMPRPPVNHFIQMVAVCARPAQPQCLCAASNVCLQKYNKLQLSKISKVFAEIKRITLFFSFLCLYVLLVGLLFRCSVAWSGCLFVCLCVYGRFMSLPSFCLCFDSCVFFFSHDERALYVCHGENLAAECMKLFNIY